jgi:peptidoglycan/xylan/chitin deacetylase (PgdA/CDA1 family)
MLRAGGRLAHAVRGLASRRSRGRGLILTYHDVGCGISSDLFKQQMDYLRRHAHVMALEALLKSVRSGIARGIACAITFDDGYEGVYLNAFPSLQECGFPAMVYLATDFIRNVDAPAPCPGGYGLAEGRPLLSWRQVREMACAGVRFGSHLCDHRNLASLGHGEATAQLCRSRDEIAARLGKPCEHFAYPFGRLSLQSVNWVRDAGYQTAVTTVHRPLAPGDDHLRLPRMEIEKRYSLQDFASMLCGDWDFIGLLQILRRPRLRM